jgi:hypothetical protein
MLGWYAALLPKGVPVCASPAEDDAQQCCYEDCAFSRRQLVYTFTTPVECVRASAAAVLQGYN